MSGEWRTSRLWARPPKDDDLPPYRGLFLNPAVGAWLRPAPLQPFDDAGIRDMLGRDIRHWIDHGFGPWALIDGETGGFVGRGGLCWTEVEGQPMVELPWAIDPDHQGRGLATEAALAAVEWARSLTMSTLVAMTIPTNLASRAVAEKAGFQISGEIDRRGLRHILYRLDL